MRFNLLWNRKRERLLSLQGGITICDVLIDAHVKLDADKKHSAGKRSGFRHSLKILRSAKLLLIEQQELQLAPRWFRKSLAWRPWTRKAAE